MNCATQSLPQPANANALCLVLSITDPEVTRALEQHEEGPPRDAYAKQALRLGVLAFQQAAGALDAETVQREGERLLGSVREALNEHTSQTSSSIARLLGGYLDPATGSLPQRLERLTKRDGEIESLLAKHLDGDRSTIAETLARKVGEESALFKLLSPSSADGLAGTVTRAIEEALRVQRDEVLRQFSLNDADSALSRLAREIAQANSKLRGEVAADVAEVKSALSFENDQTPMSRFVLRVEKAQRSVLDQLSLDCEGSAVRRLSLALDDTCATVRRSLTLDDKGSPLSLLRQELIGAVASLTESNAQFHADVRTTLATFRVRREEAARGSLHGHAFEDAAGELLQQEARRLGDVCDRLSGTRQVGMDAKQETMCSFSVRRAQRLAAASCASAKRRKGTRRPTPSKSWRSPGRTAQRRSVCSSWLARARLRDSTRFAGWAWTSS